MVVEQLRDPAGRHAQAKVELDGEAAPELRPFERRLRQPPVERDRPSSVIAYTRLSGRRCWTTGVLRSGRRMRYRIAGP